MNLFYKTTSSLLVLSSFLFMSCDSDTDLQFGGVALEDTTPTDVIVTTGELFDFEDTLNPGEEQFFDLLRVTDNNVATNGEISFNYAQTGQFTATLTALIPTVESVNDAVLQMFSVSNSANGEVRDLLEVLDSSSPAPDLTDAELERLVELLNVNGAGVVRNPDVPQQILATPFRQYLMTSTSTQRERSNGIVGGTYSLEATGQILVFNVTTFEDAEGNGFQFYLPAVGPDTLPINVFERGTYTLQLDNTIGF